MSEKENPEQNQENLDEEDKDLNVGDNVALKTGVDDNVAVKKKKIKKPKETLSFDTTPVKVNKQIKIDSLIDAVQTQFYDKILIAIAVVVVIYVIYVIAQ